MSVDLQRRFRDMAKGERVHVGGKFGTQNDLAAKAATKRAPRALDARARRAARRIGLLARKSRWRLGSIDNFGEFQIIDPVRNFVVAGARFDMTAEEVMAYCSEP